MKKSFKKSFLILAGTVSVSILTTAIACAGQQISTIENNKKTLIKIVDEIKSKTYEAKNQYKSKAELITALTASNVKSDKVAFDALLKTSPPFGESKLLDVSVSSANKASGATTGVVTLTLTYGEGNDITQSKVDMNVNFTTPAEVVRKTKTQIAKEWYSQKVGTTLIALSSLSTKKASEVTSADFASFYTIPTELTDTTVDIKLLDEPAKSDSNGTLSIKVTLKASDGKLYKTDGTLVESTATDAGKIVSVSGLKASDPVVQNATKFYTESVKDHLLKVENSAALAGLKPSKVNATTHKTDLEKLFPLLKGDSSIPDASVEVSIVEANDEQNSLKVKVTLKADDKYFSEAGIKETDISKAGKEVTITGFLNEEKFALAAYKALKVGDDSSKLLFEFTGTENSEEISKKMASQVVDSDFDTLNSVLKTNGYPEKNSLDKLNDPLKNAGFKFEIIKHTPANNNINWDNTRGSLQVELLLSSTNNGVTKYWKYADVNHDETNITVTAQDSKEGATGREAAISGFVTGRAYLTPILSSYNYKNSFTSADEENIKKLSNVFNPISTTSTSEAQTTNPLKDLVESLNALKASGTGDIDVNSVVGYHLSPIADENKWTVKSVYDQDKVASVEATFKIKSDLNEVTDAEIGIKSTNDFAEYTPYFMTVKVPNNETDIVSAGTDKNVHIGIENFANYTNWKRLIQKVATVFKTSDEKLDEFSNALGLKMVEAALKNPSLTEKTTTFYINPYPMSQLPSEVTVRTGNTKVNGIGSNQETLLLGGWAGYTSNSNKVKENGKPWTNGGNGVSRNYFEYDNIKWYFYGLFEVRDPGHGFAANGTTAVRIKRSLFDSVVRPVANNGHTVSDAHKYKNNTAIAIRFLLEAIITKDTMVRNATPSSSSGSANTGTASTTT
ncbi:lipoprotein 17-related variable surface protein [Mycoplasmopsis agassizii]|nr:lipoprotein 17-related variable surface protein [Mycoplasmopsis agassizii]SMC15949.1 Lipoprotein associated domain-containing protein [Mycoplasmopsis agassizii]